jgi:hypothetical protein
MKVLIGVDPHKASVAVAALDEHVSEFLERASFPQSRAGLRALERWAKRFPWRSRQPARVPAGSRPRRGRRDTLGPPGRPHPARRTAPGRLGSPPPAVGFGGVARRTDAGPKDRRPQRAHRSRGGSLRHHPLTEIFAIGPILAAKIVGTVGSVARFPTKAHYFASYSGTAPVDASSGKVVRHRLSSLAANLHLNIALHMVAVCQARSDGQAEATTSRRWRRANLVRRRCAASRGAS